MVCCLAAKAVVLVSQLSETYLREYLASYKIWNWSIEYFLIRALTSSGSTADTVRLKPYHGTLFGDIIIF